MYLLRRDTGEPNMSAESHRAVHLGNIGHFFIGPSEITEATGSAGMPKDAA